MAKGVVLVVVITSLITTQSVTVKGSSNVNYNQDHRHAVENAAADDRTFEQGLIRAKLKVKGSVSNLTDFDRGWTHGHSDPYMEVVATDVNGFTEKHTTPVRRSSNYPQWNDYLVFSERT